MLDLLPDYAYNRYDAFSVQFHGFRIARVFSSKTLTKAYEREDKSPYIMYIRLGKGGAPI